MICTLMRKCVFLCASSCPQASSQHWRPRLCDCLAKGDGQQMDVTFCRQDGSVQSMSSHLSLGLSMPVAVATLAVGCILLQYIVHVYSIVYMHTNVHI